MKVILKYILVVALAQSFFTANGQKSKVKEIVKEYENFSYVKTSEVLLKVAEDGYRNQDILEKLANSFYFNNNMKEASRWYGELFKNYKDIDSEYYFRYALSLKGVKNYEESDNWMSKFKELNPSDSRAKSFDARKDYKSNIESLSNDFIEIKNLDFNTEYSDFGTAFNGEDLIFASSRGNDIDEKYLWNDQPYLDLYKVYKYDDGDYSKPANFSETVNTKFHESSVAYAPDGKTMYFTRNNYFKKRARKDKKGINRLKMFRATIDDDGQWNEITPIHFNSDDYSVAHPTINAEGSRLYFASDMEDSLGESDIYVVDINADGTLGTPRNLGPSINTESQDSFPFVNSNGDLYYATVGLPGLGGYDVFVTKDLDSKMSNSSAENFVVTNMGKPFNSNADDFAFYENIDTKEGYFTSNRDGGKGDDDIYSFRQVECEQVVKGLIRDAKTTALLPGSTVVLYDGNGTELETAIVGSDAAFMFNVDCNKQYLVRGSKEKYSTDEERFTTNDSRLDLELVISLDPNEIIIEPCDDLAKALNIPLIYFDLDKYDIKYVAEIELQKVLAVLYKYPSMKLDIRSHTDCRASMAYNEKLSDNRAKATRQYLIERGISSDRLTAKGYGESQLVNDCGCEPDNDSSCSELEHQKNRRSEFIITSFKGKDCDD